MGRPQPAKGSTRAHPPHRIDRLRYRSFTLYSFTVSLVTRRRLLISADSAIAQTRGFIPELSLYLRIARHNMQSHQRSYDEKYKESTAFISAMFSCRRVLGFLAPYI
jgi:hypothetical protein